MPYRANFCIEIQTPVASPTKTAWSVISTGATVRPAIYDWVVGASGTPADNALVSFVQRITAAGTNTAYVPPPLDSGGRAANCTGGTAHSAEPTYTAAKIVAHIAHNQRATPRLLLDPDGPLIGPASASNGFGGYTVHATYTGNADHAVYFYEV